MKVINVSEFKANLSKYLRLASRGERIVVKDREKPIAQVGPLETEASSWRDPDPQRPPAARHAEVGQSEDLGIWRHCRDVVAKHDEFVLSF
jgi:antitoxin (DNA-binding transcriptional repressor) of toxin-antitoxin stability system